jgi:ribonuclease HII
MNDYILSNTTTAGVDEVGRGTLFGNVVAACVILPATFKDNMYLQIKDSKKLSFKKRSILAEYIKENAIAYGIGYVTPDVIDKINILRASIEAMHKAIYQVMEKTKVEKLIVDGTQFTPILPLHDEDEIISYECIPKADGLYLNVAAASIIAKDYHDKEILKLVNEYPELDKYDLKNNMGYATVKHRNAIDTYGLHELHRKSFRTCHNFIQKGI